LFSHKILGESGAEADDESDGAKVKASASSTRPGSSPAAVAHFGTAPSNRAEGKVSDVDSVQRDCSAKRQTILEMLQSGKFRQVLQATNDVRANRDPRGVHKRQLRTKEGSGSRKRQFRTQQRSASRMVEVERPE
jgi:hypothetical protein